MKRKDSKGYALYKGEYERKNGYCYQYQAKDGTRPCIYAKTLSELRRKEEEIKGLRYEGIEYADSKKYTVNDVVDRYISIKFALRGTTSMVYTDMYDKHIRKSFGRFPAINIKYSDVKMLYYRIVRESGIDIGTLGVLDSILRPSFSMAIRDQLIKVNPFEGVYAEIKKESKWRSSKRTPLSQTEQRIFFSYIAQTERFRHWYNIFAVMIGTGMREGEVAALNKDEIDFDNNVIIVKNALKYYRSEKTGKYQFHLEATKTPAGDNRLVPIFDFVKAAILNELETQEILGGCKVEIDGCKDFIFTTAQGRPYTDDNLNRALHRICDAYNKEEVENAAREDRIPILLPRITCHVLRHSFCARCCESGVNMKLTQKIMGHSKIQTTMNYYADISHEKEVDMFKELLGIIII